MSHVWPWKVVGCSYRMLWCATSPIAHHLLLAKIMKNLTESMFHGSQSPLYFGGCLLWVLETITIRGKWKITSVTCKLAAKASSNHGPLMADSISFLIRTARPAGLQAPSITVCLLSLIVQLLFTNTDFNDYLNPALYYFSSSHSSFKKIYI